MEARSESRLAETVRTLPPGYFALVMATGIISLGLLLEEFRAASDAITAERRPRTQRLTRATVTVRGHGIV